MSMMTNILRTPASLARLAGNYMAMRSTRAKVRAAFLKGPDSQHSDYYHAWYCTWTESEKDMYVPEDVPGVSRQEFTKYMETREDMNRMTPMLYVTFLGGGIPALLGLPIWAGSPHLMPGVCFPDEASYREAGKMRDQEVHIKHAPTAACSHRVLEHWAAMDPKFNDAYDSIQDGFTGKKDAKAIRRMAQFAGRVRTCSSPFVTADVHGWFRGGDHFHTCLFLGKPFLGMTKRALATHIVDHYRNLFLEDKLVKKEGLSTLDDFELYKLCNRRLVARWEEELDRRQLEDRYAKWCALTECKEGSEYVPIRAIVLFQTSFFRDPGFLDAELKDLDADCWPEAWNWPKDAFQRRLDFENGPLAPQVRAHMQQLQEEEKKYLASTAS